MKSAREVGQRIDKELVEPDFDRHPLTEIEAELELLEPSWADFLYGTRVTRYIRAERRRSMKWSDFDTVHRMLDHHKQQFIDGNRLAIFTALIYCIEENVPLPYWLGDEILAIWKKVNREPSNLHNLFGLGSELPAQGKRARTARRDVQLQATLWRAVKALMVKALMAKSKMSTDAAIKLAREQLGFPFGQRKSREMFDEQERIQSGYLDALKGTKKHLIK